MGQVRMSEPVVNQSYTVTYGQYWTYLEDSPDSIKDSLREGINDIRDGPDGTHERL